MNVTLTDETPPVATTDDQLRQLLEPLDRHLKQLGADASAKAESIRDLDDLRARVAQIQMLLERPTASSPYARFLQWVGRRPHRARPTFDPSAAVADAKRPVDRTTLEALNNDARRYSLAGRWMFVISFALGLLFAVASYVMTGHYIDRIENSKHPDHLLVLLLIRGGLFGGLTAGILYAAFTVANAAVDQATRFRKRVYSAHMLNYAFETFEKQIKTDKVKLSHVVALFSAWNENVDSAFSRVAFQKHGKDVVASTRFGRAGTAEPTDTAAPQPASALHALPMAVPVQAGPSTK